MSSLNSYPYNFPFPPYQIQIDLMNNIYSTVNDKKIGLFSSPTGTGKSLSIICSTFSFIKNLKKEKEEEIFMRMDCLKKKLADIDKESENSSSWVDIHSRKQRINEEHAEIFENVKIIEKFNERSKELKERRLKKIETDEIRKNKRFKKGDKDDFDEEIQKEDEYIVDYESENENEISENKEKSIVKPKIFYCSRTHSQLSQFVNEIKKTVFNESIRLVTLGSRSNLCINPSVTKLRSVNLMNEKCLDLQKSNQKCPYMKSDLMEEIKDDILGEVRDIEEVHKLGTSYKACPYYSSRNAISESEVLVIPYNILLHSKTRDSLGIDLKESIVIIDEAHNLLEAITTIYSAQINGGQLLDCLSQLNQYLIKYSSRLSSKNLMYIKQISIIVSNLIKFVRSYQDNKETYRIFTNTEFTNKSNIDNFNLFKIVQFLEQSQLARKLLGFTAHINSKGQQDLSISLSGTSAFLAKLKAQRDTSKNKTKKTETCQQVKVREVVKEKEKEKEKSNNDSSASPLYKIIEFFRCLTNPSSDGRVLFIKESDVRQSHIKFLLLNPSNQFKDIVDKSRSVLLIGGTMEPFSEFIDYLFEPVGVKKENIVCFSCDHIVPKHNILPICLSKCLSNENNFNFSFKHRNNPALIKETGHLLINLCSIIPGGIIVYFPSYEYEKLVYDNWIKIGIIKKIESLDKKIFREPKNSSQVNKVLINYAKRIDNAVTKYGGAILLSVVGGKMSEGINFSDKLGRCVVMIGLPYPNLMSPELKEKMAWIAASKKGTEKIYYENLCMKAVNQSIGRVIRHKNDYACIFLLDERYCKSSVYSNLPNWIKKSLKISSEYGKAIEEVKVFFLNKLS